MRGMESVCAHCTTAVCSRSRSLRLVPSPQPLFSTSAGAAANDKRQVEQWLARTANAAHRDSAAYGDALDKGGCQCSGFRQSLHRGCAELTPLAPPLSPLPRLQEMVQTIQAELTKELDLLEKDRWQYTEPDKLIGL